ncbi:MAG: LapA family protein [Ilumatobacteraceae bacterium]
MHDGERREDDGDVVHTSSGPSVALIAFVVLGVAGIVFILQNSDSAKLDFLFIGVEWPVWVALAITLGLGVLLDRLVLFWWRRRRRRGPDA